MIWLYRPTLPTGVRGRFAALSLFPLLGRRQVVRQWILIPPYGGSNPPAPARQSGFRLATLRSARKGRKQRSFAFSLRSPNSYFALLAGQIAESLRPFSKIFPFSGDYGRRLGSNVTDR